MPPPLYDMTSSKITVDKISPTLFEDIQRATNNFADEFFKPKRRGLSTCRAQIMQATKDGGKKLIDVRVSLFNRDSEDIAGLAEQLWLFDVLLHKNILPLLGLLLHDDSDKGLLVFEYETNGSLDKHLSGATLTWIQRLRICIGVASALIYLHFGGEGYIIHGNIKSSKILLDDNLAAKLYDFSVATILKKAENIFLTDKYMGTLPYMDPAYEKTRGINTKSDVFSFGVVLFEVLFGRIASIQDGDNWYFARLARRHYEEKTLDEMIDPELRQQMDPLSLNIFSETAYYCLKEQRGQRPNAKQIFKRLTKALELQIKYENLEASTKADLDTSSDHWKDKNLEHLKIRLSDIQLATNNFADTYEIGSGGYGVVYCAELDHFDISMENKDNSELPKKRSTVAIKRIFKRDDKQGKQGFFVEIDLLTSCKHPNIISLLGFCDEGPDMLLVYEYASNGSLEDYLGNTSKLTNLTWARRIKICLDIANGLSYLHMSTLEKHRIIHRDIKSANIVLADNWEAKIADFGLSKLHAMSMNEKGSTINTKNIAGTEVYLDPEYLKTGKLKKESDIYSFGVVLVEIMCGRVAYDEFYYLDNEKGLASFARRCFNEGRIQEMVDPKIKEADENIFLINRGLNQDSVYTFSKIAYQCLAEAQRDRPSMEVIIKELETALSFEKEHKDSLQIPLEDVTSATENFSDNNYLGSGRYWKAYKGKVPHADANGHTTIVAKRWDKSDQGDHQFSNELIVLFKFKHETIVGLIGYCEEGDEKITVYEHASNGNLDKYLNDASLAWRKCLKICIDAVSGLEFLQTTKETRQGVIHNKIRSSSILLDSDWKAKISSSELTCMFFPLKNAEAVAYIDPEYGSSYSFLKESADVYDLGVILFEILCGRLAWAEEWSESSGPEPKSLTTFQDIAYKCLNYNDEQRPRAYEVVEELIEALKFREDIEIWETKLPKDYKEIIHMSGTSDVYSTKTKRDLYDIFTKGILLQEDKVWFSIGSNGERNKMISARYFSYKKRRLHKWRSVPESRFPKVAEMLDISNLMIRIKITTQFLSQGVNYRVRLIFKFVGVNKSVAKRMYVNLKYKRGNKDLHSYFATWREDEWMTIELGRFLYYEEDTDFEVLLESFSRCYCGSHCIYVEGIEFQAIDNMIHEKVEKLEEVQAVDDVLKYEIEKVQAIDKMKYEETEKWRSNLKWDKLQSLLSKMNIKNYDMLSEVNTKKDGLLDKVYTKKDHLVKNHMLSAKEVFYESLRAEHSSNSSADSRLETDNEEIFKISNDHDECEKLLSLSKVNGHMLSAKETLYCSANAKLLRLKPSVHSRFQEVIELVPIQVFQIKYKIRSQMLLPDTEYVCYLVFKLSQKCCGLHCPVIVRDLLRWKNKKNGVVYFRSANLWNLHDTDKVPKKREDGWMEVNVWKFNSNFDLRDDCVPMNLKLITYEGTMSGLIVCGLDIRPV